MRLGVWLAVVLGIGCSAACGGDDDDAAGPDAAPEGPALAGWYMVTSHETGECGAMVPAAELIRADYLLVETLQTTHYVRFCTGTTEDSCNSGPYYDFNEPIANGMHGEGGTSFYSAVCTLAWERADLVLSNGQLDVSSRRFEIISDTIADSDCNLRAAEMLAGPCTYETQVIAVPF